MLRTGCRVSGKYFIKPIIKICKSREALGISKNNNIGSAVRNAEIIKRINGSANPKNRQTTNEGLSNIVATQFMTLTLKGITFN